MISLKSTYSLKNKPKIRNVTINSAVAVAAFLLLLLQPQAAIDSMWRSMQLCAKTIIPSLFPFLVVADLLVSSGVGERMGGWLSRPICAVFGVSRCGAVVYLLGILCGFHVAARTAAAYVRRGKITTEEMEHLLCFCNVPSAAFVIGAVGVSLYRDAALGRLLYLAALLSAAVVGVLLRPSRNLRSLKCSEGNFRTDASACDEGLTGAIAAAAAGMLSVIATVLFFGAVVGSASALLEKMLFLAVGGERAGGALLRCLICGIFEMTGGVSMAAELAVDANGGAFASLSPLFSAGILGWGGVSVHLQLLSACGEYRGQVHVGKFYLARLLQALVCVLTIMLAVLLRG
jgi:sporulation integral membrane protein YlbJ